MLLGRIQVRLTMRAIRHVLTERFYTWEDAVELAKTDPEINLAGQGSAYTPGAFVEDDPVADQASLAADGPEKAETEAAAAAAVDPALLDESAASAEQSTRR